MNYREIAKERHVVKHTYLPQDHERLPFYRNAEVVASVLPGRTFEVCGVQLLSRGGIVCDDDRPMIPAIWTPV